MLLDVLSKLPELKICTAYEVNGRKVTQFPSHVDDLRVAVRFTKRCPAGTKRSPRFGKLQIYQRMPGVICSGLSELVGRPVEVVSVGPDREQTIFAGEGRREAVQLEV